MTDQQNAVQEGAATAEGLYGNALRENVRAFEKELIGLLNKHGMDAASDTPDFILGKQLTTYLVAAVVAYKSRDTFFQHVLAQKAADAPRIIVPDLQIQP